METRYCRIALSATLIVVAVGFINGQGKPISRTVSALELQSGTQIIGILGLPLGEVASIKAKIVETNTKGDGWVVEVVEVNGRAPSVLLQMRYSVWEWGNIGKAPLPVGRLLNFRAYETGGMVGVPIEAMKETTFVQTEGWGFGTSLILLNRE